VNTKFSVARDRACSCSSNIVGERGGGGILGRVDDCMSRAPDSIWNLELKLRALY